MNVAGHVPDVRVIVPVNPLRLTEGRYTGGTLWIGHTTISYVQCTIQYGELARLVTAVTVHTYDPVVYTSHTTGITPGVKLLT